MLRLRSFNGFINESELTKEWVKNNPSFTVYKDNVQVGRISKEPFDAQRVVMEVFDLRYYDNAKHIHKLVSQLGQR